jgi:YHS domain-containing protein
MTFRTIPSLVAVFMLLAGGSLWAADKCCEGTSTCTCPISGGPIDKSVSVDYKGGKVYFCCGGCISKFKSETAKYAVQANQQLVATGQAKQIACPLTGKPAKASTALKVGGVDVCFCCGGCRGAVAKADAAKQCEMCFGEKFDKAFKVAK